MPRILRSEPGSTLPKEGKNGVEEGKEAGAPIRSKIAQAGVAVGKDVGNGSRHGTMIGAEAKHQEWSTEDKGRIAGAAEDKIGGSRKNTRR